MAKDLRSFLDELARVAPGDLLRIARPVMPHQFEVTAILQQLEERERYPLLLFEAPRSVEGHPCPFRLVSNVFATRERCALALGLEASQSKLPLSLEYARRERQPLSPLLLAAAHAPVKEVVRQGEEVDLSIFPIVRHHAMDAAPYFDMAVVNREPREGFYNTAFQRTMYKGPRRLGIHQSPRHNWQIVRSHARQGRRAPIIIVVGHHPAFYLGCLNVAAYGVDDYELIGGIIGEPLRLTSSATWGEEFLIPADAELVIEGELDTADLEVEAPFGEFTGYYGPQRLRPVIHVTAVNYRADAILQHNFVGHPDCWVLGGIPKEGAIYNLIKGVVPGVTAVHFPLSGSCRFNCYISVDKRVDGETKQAALLALGAVDFVKNVIVVDADIDVFTERQVMFAVATRTQADQDVEIIRNAKGNTLDPSQTHDIMGSKLIIDATMPLDRPFAERVAVPKFALEKFPLEQYFPREA